MPFGCRYCKSTTVKVAALVTTAVPPTALPAARHPTDHPLQLATMNCANSLLSAVGLTWSKPPSMRCLERYDPKSYNSKFNAAAFCAEMSTDNVVWELNSTGMYGSSSSTDPLSAACKGPNSVDWPVARNPSIRIL